ncbi:ABC transporter ATPase [Rossellomorea vietnamensis]|uniref:ABC transporter ATPase n=1 Tax=Rossellomorea vietnamensis TaxID=218284 RepID=A0A5D4M621_9BACI|nr:MULTISPECIES: ABC transporter ATPase [Bacillaceae]TYR97389.1 ABC transporter ATPase [Rossellomorea vietnamensis]
MLNKLPEHYFEVLKAPIISGRQSPNSFGGNLIASILLQWLIYYITYSIASSYTKYPGTETIKEIHFAATICTSILCLLFGIPAIYKRFEKLQYLVSILVSHMLFTVPGLLWALFTIGQGELATAESLVTFTVIIIVTAVLLLGVTIFRFLRLLKKGEYQEGSTRGQIRERFEAKSYLPIAVVGGLGCVFVIQYFIRNFQMESLESVTLIVLPILIFYGMIFVLPEQLVILYCKFRFDDFNIYQRRVKPPKKVGLERKG